MKRMTALLVIILVVLLLGGWMLHREIRRAPLMPPEYGHEAEPMNAWQSGIKIDQRTDYTKGGKTDPLMEKLRQEELRQKPQEGRN